MAGYGKDDKGEKEKNFLELTNERQIRGLNERNEKLRRTNKKRK